MENQVRDEIVRAAYVVLQQAGPSKLRIQDVARQADVSPTLLYYYFEGKHDLIAAAYALDYTMLVNEDLDRVQAAFAATSSLQEFGSAVFEAFEDGVTTSQRRGRRLDVLAAAQHDAVVADAIREPQCRLSEGLRDIIEGCQSRGWIDMDLDIELVVLGWLALPFGMCFLDVDPSLEVNRFKYLRMMLAPGVLTEAKR